MSELLSTKPYMVRAIHEWCVDNGLTPHLLVAVNAQTRVPIAYVKEGEIVLNLNYTATKDLQIDADAVTFSARFSGVSNHLYVPMSAVRGIYARENGQGMFFEIDPTSELNNTQQAESSLEKNDDSVDKEKKLSVAKRPSLKLVK